jgi:hypothetical protein
MKWVGQVVQHFVICMLGAVAPPKLLFEIILEKWMVCDTIECEGDCLLMVLTENVIRSA